MKILVTGGCGFIGSNLIHHILETKPDTSVLNVDALTYAADPANLEDLEGNPRYSFERVDIRNVDELARVFAQCEPDALIHLAAESHVDNSIAGPSDFVTTNLVGTYNLLSASNDYRTTRKKPFRFLHVSTDEVYGELGEEGAFSETDAYRPNSPYSATKAGSDHLVRAWHTTYGLDVVTTNCSNNFGPRQHREKLIPTVIATALRGDPIPVYGAGQNVRDWLYVDDHCRAIMASLERGEAGETYLIGTRNEWSNINLVRKICGILDEEVGMGKGDGYADQITFVTDRPGHDHRYAVDPTKIQSELGWKPVEEFDHALRRTVRWYASRFQAGNENPIR